MERSTPQRLVFSSNQSPKIFRRSHDVTFKIPLELKHMSYHDIHRRKAELACNLSPHRRQWENVAWPETFSNPDTDYQ
ncbi:hypothetical protein NPIL_225651 [Nephila pilipes]|uniref:Uncharacterized protein n=1 Tax=Nephila pilipes TaxID=299642 RepID=A0A8X6UL72_NEPPI|nr:hypothetical protein NPIL_225651 [Nephila pilipes]